jgi:8-oxo-dGTP pyrophosphatase MutT (NUDIX family)
VTNAAARTTPGSGDLRRGDFDRPRIERLARELEPRVIAFVGKEAYRGLFDERPELGPQIRSLRPGTGLFVLPSTSPANAAVPYVERLRWFTELRAWIDPEPREAIRAVVVDAAGRILLCEYTNSASGAKWWGTPGGGIDPGEDDETALRRELLEETGLRDFELGPQLYEYTHVFPWNGRLLRQHQRLRLVRVVAHDPSPTIDVAAEGVTALRWWTLAELERLPPDELAPPELLGVLHHLP